FQKIVEHYDVVPFSEAILAWVIIGTNLVMMFGLISSGSTEEDILRINATDGSSTDIDYDGETEEVASSGDKSQPE
ncbi:MAG: hypothetical protein JKX68_00515, partial [Flavobacteriales bacterium]|nr:hypothetical protein [Flavobacteriales bacterium]